MKFRDAAHRLIVSEANSVSFLRARRGKYGLLLFFCLLMASAQTMRAEEIQTQQPAAPESATTGNEPADNNQEWKFVTLFSAILTHDDNVFIQPANKKEDTYAHIAPTFAFGVGNFRSAIASFAPVPHFLVRTYEEELPWRDFVYLSYTPDGLVFSKYHKQDVVNHDAKLAAQRERDRWTLNGDLHFQTDSEPVIDVGRRIRQRYYTGDLDAAYMLSGKITTGIKLYGNRSEYAGGFSSTDGRAGGYIDYQIAPKTAIGVGAAGGYLEVAHGSNQTYEQPLVELKYQATSKLSFTGQGGMEFRQFDSHIPDRTHAVFDLSGNFAPADGTEFILTSRRDTLASAEYAGENIVESIYEASLRQRLFQRIYGSVAGGYAYNKYENNELRVPVQRHDDYYFYKVSAAFEFTRRGTIALSYEHRENDSSIAAFGFKENLASLAVSFLF